MNNFEIKDFIGVFNDAYSKDFCDRVIKNYEDSVASGHGKTRRESAGWSKTSIDDTQIFADEIDYIPLRHLTSEFTQKFYDIYLPAYEQEYAPLKDSPPYSSYCFKIQKTKIGGGYHLWHYESAARECANRVLVWTLYLNDVVEGGETEFLYQHRRIKPQQGTFCLFPASFTHTHRGNPPLSNDKYIVTGWVEF